MRPWTASSPSICPPRRPRIAGPRGHLRRLALWALLAGVASCAWPAPQAPAPSADEARQAAPDPHDVGAVVVLGVELPAQGSIVGAHYQGQLYDVRRASYSLTTERRAAWSAAARRRAEALAREAGFTVRDVAPVTRSSRRVDDARFGIRGRATALEIQSSGQVEPYLVSVTAEVSWEVLDLSSGSTIFARAAHGAVRQRGEVDDAAAAALDQTLLEFLGDGAVLRALASHPGPDSAAVERVLRPVPGRDEVIPLGPADRNPSGELRPVGRVAQGLVALSGPGGGGWGTAMLLSKGGLGLTTIRSARAMRGAIGARARLYSGLERPVRLVRISRSYGVALVQVDCGGDCPTVDWELPSRVEASTPVLVVGAGEEGVGTLSVRETVLGGRWGLARGVTLGARTQDGGAVALPDDGQVFGIVVTVGERRVVMMLGESLRALGVRPLLPPAS